MPSSHFDYVLQFDLLLSQIQSGIVDSISDCGPKNID